MRRERERESFFFSFTHLPFFSPTTDEPKYCTCQQVSYGEMIGCDEKDCVSVHGCNAATACLFLFPVLSLFFSHNLSKRVPLFSLFHFSPFYTHTHSSTAIRVVSLSLRQPKVETKGQMVLRALHEETQQQQVNFSSRRGGGGGGDASAADRGIVRISPHFCSRIQVQIRSNYYSPAALAWKQVASRGGGGIELLEVIAAE